MRHAVHGKSYDTCGIYLCEWYGDTRYVLSKGREVCGLSGRWRMGCSMRYTILHATISPYPSPQNLTPHLGHRIPQTNGCATRIKSHLPIHRIPWPILSRTPAIPHPHSPYRKLRIPQLVQNTRWIPHSPQPITLLKNETFGSTCDWFAYVSHYRRFL